MKTTGNVKEGGFDFYLGKVQSLIKEVQEKRKESIFKAAEMIAESLARGELMHVFGAGHSMLLAQDIFYRAGGLVQVDLVSDIGLTMEIASNSSWHERQEGYAKLILDKHQLIPGEVMLVISTGGINPVPIEMALEAKKRGLKVVALTSVPFAKSVKSRHSSGKKLFEIADIVIDTGTTLGDAIVKIESMNHNVGATSTIVGSAILQSLVVRVVEIMVKKGLKPPIWFHSNVPGGDEANAEHFKKYKVRVRHL